MNDHENYMQRCLSLAAKGAGTTAPNPMVGAVLVYDHRIIGEGWHERYGEPHAEVNAVNDAIRKGNGGLIADSSLYVSLEPCAHFGKTPPCTDLIFRYGIKKVYIGTSDPFESVDGRGIEQLKQKGLNVTVGVLESACREINRRFFTFHLKKRPYIILKWAQTHEGFVGSRKSRILISGELTNRLVHKWRSEEAAILIGPTTALADDPLLTNRLWTGNSPIRLVLDPGLKLSPGLRLFNGQTTLVVFNLQKDTISGKDREQWDKVEYFRLEAEPGFLEQLGDALHTLGILSVLVEGGARLLQSFIDEGLWDECRVITSSSAVGMIEEPVLSPGPVKGTHKKEIAVGSDEIVFLRNG